MKQASEFVDLVFKLSRGKENSSFNKSNSHLGISIHAKHPIKPEATTSIGQQPIISKQHIVASKSSNAYTNDQTAHQQPKHSMQPFERATHIRGTDFDTRVDPFGEFPQRWAHDVTEISEELGFTDYHPKNTTLRDGAVLNQRRPLVEPTLLKAYSNDPNFGQMPPVRLDLMTPNHHPEDTEINQSSRSKSYLISKQGRHIPLVQQYDRDQRDPLYRDQPNLRPIQHNQEFDQGLSNPPQGITDSSNFMDSSRQSGSRDRDRSRRRNTSNVKINLKTTHVLPPQPPLPKPQAGAPPRGASAQKYLTNDFANLPLSDESSEERQVQNPEQRGQPRAQPTTPLAHTLRDRGASPAFDAYPDPCTPVVHPQSQSHRYSSVCCGTRDPKHTHISQTQRHTQMDNKQTEDPFAEGPTHGTLPRPDSRRHNFMRD